MKKIIYSVFFLFFFISSQFAAVAQPEDTSATTSKLSSAVNNEVRLSVYPVPTTGVLNISYNVNQNANPKVTLFDILGNRLNNIETERISATTFTLNVGDKKPGYYFIKIQDDNGTVSRRITISQ